MANLLSDLGNWAAKTFTPQKQQPQQVQPSFMNRVQQALGSYSQAYQKVSPYIPFAPQITTSQQIQQNWKPVVNTVKNTPILSMNPYTSGMASIQTALKQKPITIGDLPRLMTPEGQKQVLQQKGGDINQYLVNRYAAPISQIPYNISKGNVLGALGGVASVFPDPIQDVAMPLADYVKGVRANVLQREAKGEKVGVIDQKAIMAGIKSASLEKPVGLGDAMTTNEIGKVIGNLAELPLSVLLIGGTKKKEYTFSKETIDTIRNGFSPEVRKLVGKFAEIIEEQPSSVSRKNMGELGSYIQSLAETVFGKEGANLTNKQLKNAFDLAMYQADKGGIPKRFSIGLTAKNAREGLNEMSGLPAEGLTSQPAQKRNLMSSLYDRYLNESRNVLNNMGQAGQQISKRIDSMYQEAQMAAGRKVADLTKSIGNLDNKNYEEVIRALRGEKSSIPTTDPRIQNIRNILDTIQKEAKDAGLDVGYIKNYVPQMVDIDKLKANRIEAIKHFVDTKQFKDVTQATQFVDDIINGTDIKEAYNRFGKTLPKKMGNLEFERVLDWAPKVLRNDKKLLPDYIEQAYSRIAQTKYFGKNNEIGTNLLNNIQKQGFDVKQAQNILDQNLGLVRYDKTLQKASGVIRGLQAAMKLSTGAITNATQSVNTATVGGVRRTLGQIFRYANPAERKVMNDYALRTGATLNGTMQQILDQWKGGKTPLEKLIAPFFGQVENFNRVIAANVGRAKALSEGVADEKGLLKAGQEMVDKTQFQVRPIDLPSSWSTPIGKIVTQFKSFGFRQADFVMNEIVKKAQQGDIKPLARFLLTGILTNEVANNLKSVINRNERPENIVGRIIEDIPGMGYYQDFLESLAYGIKASSYDKDALPNAIFDFVAGPTGGDIRKAFSNAGSLMQGNAKPFLKDTVRNIPFVGKPFLNENPQLFGGKAPIKITGGTNTATYNITSSGSTLLDKQRLTDQISELNKQKKAIYDQAGVNVFGQNFGTMTDQQKIAKMTQLEAQITDLENKKKLMDIKFEMPTSPKLTGNTELDKKLMSKYKGELTTQANNVLKLYEAGMMTKDEAENSLAQIKGVVNSFAKAKKPKKISIGKIKIPKISNIKVKTFKPKKFKMPKMPKLLTSKKKRSTIKIKA